MLPPRIGLEGEALDDRITQLREATIATYCRPRKLVEEEIQKRHFDLLRDDGQDDNNQEVRPITPEPPKQPRRPRSEKLS